MRRIFLLLAVFIAFVQSAQAQLQVTLDIKRRFFMMYEPIIATVTIKNLTGRDLLLADSPSQSWFGFQINRPDGQLVPPIDPDYRLHSFVLPMGETVKRRIALNNLFPICEAGMFRIRAQIYLSTLEKYYQSQLVNIELSEGKTVWQQTVGVPEGMEGAGGTRRLSLLTFRDSEYTSLYARVENIDTGAISSTMPLGRVIAGMDPDAQVDLQNNLHILQVAGPKMYHYTCVGLNGEVLQQNNYTSAKVRPVLRRNAAGVVVVKGGDLQVAKEDAATSGTGRPVTKLSDRPVQVPNE